MAWFPCNLNSNLGGNLEISSLTVSIYAGSAGYGAPTTIDTTKFKKMTISSVTAGFSRAVSIFGDNTLLDTFRPSTGAITNITLNKTYDISNYDSVSFKHYANQDYGYGEAAVNNIIFE